MILRTVYFFLVLGYIAAEEPSIRYGIGASEQGMSYEDRQIVGLLERVEAKFEKLDLSERKQFVEKMSEYEDKFSVVLDKVETIPGMLGLNVQMLRENLGIPNKAENIEEIHDPVPPPTDDGLLGSAKRLMEKSSSYQKETPKDDKPVAKPKDDKLKADKPPSGSEKTLDDVYIVLAQLVELVLIQISHEAAKTTTSSITNPYDYMHMTPFMQYDPNYNYILNPNLRYPGRNVFGSLKKNGRNKRKRRSTRGHETAADNEYSKWYNEVYIPWYRQYQKEMNEYYLKLAKYEMDLYKANLPSNPFGGVNEGKNKFYKYSKSAYGNFLHEQVRGLDPETIHKEAFDKWKCERTSTRVDGVIEDGQSCWCYTVGTPVARAGFCGTSNGDDECTGAGELGTCDLSTGIPS